MWLAALPMRRTKCQYLRAEAASVMMLPMASLYTCKGEQPGLATRKKKFHNVDWEKDNSGTYKLLSELNLLVSRDLKVSSYQACVLTDNQRDVSSS